MEAIPSVKPSSEPVDADPTPRLRPKTLVQEYFLEHLPIYRELRELQREGWESEAADAHFQKLRQRADNADTKTKTGFFKLMVSIGRELDHKTSALTIRRRGQRRILDLCMAPGGFSLAALRRNPSALLRGISLPPSQGGHDMLLKDSWSDTNPHAQIYVSFRDITLFADEMGAPTSRIPASHPDAASFSSDRPFLGEQFDLVFCDGQVVHTHKRLEYREPIEPTRLLTSQLVLGLQRIRSGGTMVILLHKADAWPCVLLTHTFSRMADTVVLYKPQTAHKKQSSFYLVARGVRPRCDAALAAVAGWKAKWGMATFGLGEGGGSLGEAEEEVLGSGAEEKVRGVLREFGPELVRMVEPVFAVQAEALRTAPWMKQKGGGGGKVVLPELVDYGQGGQEQVELHGDER